MRNLRILNYWSIVLFTGLELLLFSCKKENPTLARITVLDEAGEVVPHAKVRLHPGVLSGHSVLDDTLITNVFGQCVFNYTDDFNLGTSGFAVLDIDTWMGDSLFGHGIIKIEEEKHNEEVVIIQPL